LWFPPSAAVIVPSRNGAGFWLILRETSRNHRHFPHSASSTDRQAVESIGENRSGQACIASAADVPNYASGKSRVALR